MTIFQRVENCLNKDKPFVIFREPTSADSNVHHVKMYVQRNQQVNTIREFSESGFVMAPFDLATRPSILFPLSDSAYYEEAIKPEGTPLPHPPLINNTPTNARLQHLNLVAEGIKAIEEGLLKKVVLSRSLRFSAQAVPAPGGLFRSLLSQYPEAFVYLWHHPKIGTWLGATPETLLKIEGRYFKTMALAATQIYEAGKLPEWTKKEIEEQNYVSQYIKNQLSPYSGQLHIKATENGKAGKLWHLKSKIEGRLKESGDPTQVLTQLHPTPAVCGLPKEKAKAFILENENYQRLFYSGFLGEINIPKSSKSSRYSRLYVNLRCMQIQSENLQVYVGGGIVKGSIPEQEWQETVNKSRTLLDIFD